MDIADRNGFGVSCYGGSDGQATASVTGNTGPVAYAWAHGPSTATVSALSAGDYTVIATDSIGQADTLEVTITQPFALSATYSLYLYPNAMPFSCATCQDAQATLVPAGGVGPYIYVWAHGPVTATATGLSQGTTYHYTVADTNGCSYSDSLTMPTMPPPTAPLSGQLHGVNSVCLGQDVGQLGVIVSGGTPPYQYLWSTADGSVHANGSMSPFLQFLAAGTYDLQLTDMAGDTVLLSQTLTAPTAIASGIVPSFDEQGYQLQCGGNGETTLDLSVSGGTPPYTYLWDNARFTQDIEVRDGGMYRVMIRDGKDCVHYDSVMVNAPAPIQLDADWHIYPNGQLFSCDTCNDAQLTIIAQGGVAPLTITLIPIAIGTNMGTQTGGVFTGIYADSSYSLVVEDALGCTLEMSGEQAVTVPRGGFTSLQVSATLSNYPGGYNVSTMGGMDGSIELNVTGQMSQVTIQWSDGNTSAHRTGLMAGTYNVTVSDNAAQSESKSYTLIEPQNSMSVMLYGNYSGCTMNGNINAMVNGGTPPYSYLWHGPMGPMMTDTWSMVTVWQPGMYGVWAVDANGDSAHAELTLQAEASVWAELSSPTLYGTANTGCTGNDGSIVIAIHGGAPPYMIGVSSRWSAVSSVMPPASSPPGTSPPQPGQTNLALTQGTYLTTSDTLVVINNLGAGNYDVKVSTMGGCGGSYQSIELTSPPELNVRVQPTVLPNGHYLSCDSCADATAQINVAGGTGPFQYAWMEMPEGEGDSNMRLKGASLFMKMKDPSTGSGQAGEAFGPSNPYLIGSDAQQSGLDGEKRYAAFAMDGLGCMGGETFILEKPKGGTFAADSLRARHIRVERISSYTPSDSLIFFGDSSIIFNHQQHHIFAYTGYRGPVVGSAGTPKDLQIQCQPAVLAVGTIPGTNHTFLNRYRGNVGIGTGTETPLARLDVRGQTYSQTLSVNTYDTPAKLTVKASSGQGALEVQDADGNASLRVFNDGKVTIGVDDPEYELEVCGTIRSKEVIVEVNGWCDYVFDDDYQLRSIDSLRIFIAENGHLPEVPSTSEVSENGVELGELNRILLKKIEELTLYVMELKDANDALRNDFERARLNSK